MSDGTLPAGSTWQMNPIPGWAVVKNGRFSSPPKRWFDPPCHDPLSLHPPEHWLDQGLCSGEWHVTRPNFPRDLLLAPLYPLSSPAATLLRRPLAPISCLHPADRLTKVTTYDQLRVPEHLLPGEYVLGFRWDCESSAQVWQSCADITISA